MTYIGKTKRHLFTRVEEHLDLNKPEKKSEVKTHIQGCVACRQRGISLDNFTVIRKFRNDYDCQINEALLIRKFKPKLNIQLFNSGASFLLKVF